VEAHRGAVFPDALSVPSARVAFDPLRTNLTGDQPTVTLLTSPPRSKAVVVALAILLAGVAVFLALYESPRALPATWFVLAVIVAGRAAGWRGAVVATAVSTPGLWYSVLPPRRTFTFTHWDQPTFLLGFVLVGGAIALAEVRHERANQRLATAQEMSRALQRLSSRLSVAQTPQQVADAVVESLARVNVAEALAVGFVTDTQDALEWFAVQGDAGSMRQPHDVLHLSTPCVTTEALRSRQVTIVNGAEDSTDYLPLVDGFASARGALWASWPLVAERKVIGAFDLRWRDATSLDAVDAAFFDTSAELCAQALLRAKLFADEHRIATALQKRLLLDGSRTSAGAKVTVRYLPATHPSRVVGGDWHDAVELPDRSLFVSVGDVIGHGAAAAADMMQLRVAAHTLAIDGRTPGEVLAGLNTLTQTYEIFATAVVATFDRSSGRFRFAVAGHPPPLVRRVTGEVEFLQTGRNRLLGVPAADSIQEDEVELSAGDVVILYTDGLVERRGQSIDDGFDRLAASVAGSQPDHATLCNDIVADCLGGDARSDDVCLLLLSPSESRSEDVVDVRTPSTG
jgi:serine phosphatase RsbU (regulator of sigma subunit)